LGEKDLLSSMPTLPGRGIFESKTTHLSHEKNRQRMQDLDAWLQNLLKLVIDNKIHHKLLREHLELTTEVLSP